MGISPRYVRRLFQEETGSFSAYVLDERLDRAHRLLLHPGLVPRTIAAIAYACGFGDLSYFNSTFRRRFGLTPSDLRDVNGQVRWRHGFRTTAGQGSPAGLRTVCVGEGMRTAPLG